MAGPSDGVFAPFQPRSAEGDVAEPLPQIVRPSDTTANFISESGSDINSILEKSGDLVGRPTISEVQAARDKGNPFKRVIGAGNSWGVFKLPGGLPMINPLKSLWSGLGYVQHNVSDPAFGFAVGGLSMGLSSLNLPYNYKAKQVAEQFKGTVFDDNGSSAWQSAGNFTRDRESLFPTDKFLGSIIFDPTSYIGFGILGKVPIAGKFLLGPLEGAYIRAVAAPFRLGGRYYSKLPKTRGQTETLIRSHSGSKQRVAMVDVLGTGESFTQIAGSKMKLKQVMGKVLNVAEYASSKLTRNELFLRQTVVQTPIVTMGKISKLLEHARADLDLFFEPAGYVSREGAGRLDPHLAQYQNRALAKVQDALESHTMGRLSTQETAENIVFIVGGSSDSKSIKLVEKWVETNTETLLRNAENRVAQMSPQQFVDFYSEQAGRIYSQNQAQGFNELKRQMGVAGALLGYMDDWQTKWYQQKLRKAVIRPMATNVLGFFSFGGQEAGESVLRQMMGRSGIGFRNQVEGSSTLGLFDNTPYALLSRETEQIATRGVSAEGGTASLSGYIENKFRGGRTFNKYVGSKLKYLNARTYVAQAGRISQMARTQFLMNRAVKHNLVHLNETNPELVAILDEVPAEWIGGKSGQRLWEDAILRASSGNTQSLRNLVNETFNVRKMNSRELVDIVEKYGGANNLPPNVMEDIINQLESGISGKLGRQQRTSGLDIEINDLQKTLDDLAEELEVVGSSPPPFGASRKLRLDHEQAQFDIMNKMDRIKPKMARMRKEKQQLDDLNLADEDIRITHAYRTRDELAVVSDRQLGEEALAVNKTHISGLNMESSEFSGTYVSTEAGNRYMHSAQRTGRRHEIHDVEVTIENTKIYRDPFVYSGYKERFLPEGVTIDDATDQQIIEAGKEATESLKAQGYDSVYLPESIENEGILVVFDQSNVSLSNARLITDDLVKSEENLSRIALDTNNQWTKATQFQQLMDETIEEAFDDFVQSAEGMVIAMDLNLEQIALAEAKFISGDMTASEIHVVLQNMNNVSQGLSSRVEQINAAAMRQLEIRGKKMNRFQKQALFDNVRAEVNSMFSRMQPQVERMTETLQRVEATVFNGDNWFTSNWRRDIDDLQEAWIKDKELVDDYFQAWDGEYTDEFWEGYRVMRREHWDSVNAKRVTNQEGKDEILKARRLRDVGMLDEDIAPKIIAKDFSNRGLTPEDIGYIVGRQSENITQAIISGSFYNQREFRQYVMRMAREGGHTGVTQKKVDAIFASVLDRLGFNSKFHTAFEAQERGIKAMFGELDASLKSPKFGQGQEAAARTYINKVAGHIDNMPVEQQSLLKQNGQNAMDQAADDLTQEFVNYEGNNVVDDLFQGLFPFYTYESRRMAWLLQNSFDHPALFANVGPEGRYYEATDKGYMNVFNTWMDINYFGGTMLNTPRRLFRAEFPAHDQGGFRGFYSQMEQQLGQFGFYFGSHVTAALEGYDLIMGKEAELGEALPPFGFGAIPLGSGGLAAMEMSKIPLVSQAARTMRNQLFHDRFREWGVAKVMIENGLPLEEVDFKTMKPVEGALQVTQDDINDASWKSAGLEFIAESMGNVRFRGPAERKYREARDVMWSEIAGMTIDELNKIKWDGVPLTSIFNLPPDVSRTLGNIPNADQFSMANQRLQPELVADASAMMTEFWKQVDFERGLLKIEQEKDNAQWSAIEDPMAPARWASNRTSRGASRAGTVDTLRGITRGVDGTILGQTQTEFSDVPFTEEEYIALQKKTGSSVMPLRHDIEELTEGYFAISLKVDENGEPLWGQFFNDQLTYEQETIPDDLRGAFFENLDHNLTAPEAVLRTMRRGIIRDYFKIEENLAKEMGTTELLAAVKKARAQEIDLAQTLTAGPQWKTFDRAVTAAKEEMRILNPRLDYALNIFGIIGEDLSFKSNVARQWYKEDGQRPKLSRLN